MKLAIAVNHAAPFFTGGSEKVVEQITSSMHRDYGIECFVLSKYASKEVFHRGAKVIPLKSEAEDFITQVKKLKPDHMMTYSDSFHHWPTVVRRAEHFPCKKSIALVGMNRMKSNPELYRTFIKKKDQFTTITHSDNYQDYRSCDTSGVDVTVIPNGLDKSEFVDQGLSFKEQYKIPTNRKMLLCVSNFFPGKGQEHLFHILKKLGDRRQDFVAVFICTTVNFRPAEVLRERFTKQLKRANFKNKILLNIPRQHTIQAFLEADMFIFPSQIEVAPLVVLEAMACKLPWISLNVGNVPLLDGGTVIKGGRKIKDRLSYDTGVYEKFGQGITQLMDDEDLRKQKGEEGYARFLSEFNWDVIKEQYHKVFTEQ